MGTGGGNTPMIAIPIQDGRHSNANDYMGWPDDHTRYKADGTEQADTHRYKQCGNGVASPVAQWIAKHILAI
jgi:site-specific DNA-cytosine methylase